MPKIIMKCWTKSEIAHELQEDPDFCKKQGIPNIEHCYATATVLHPQGCDGVNSPGGRHEPAVSGVTMGENLLRKQDAANEIIYETSELIDDYGGLLASQVTTSVSKLTKDAKFKIDSNVDYMADQTKRAVKRIGKQEDILNETVEDTINRARETAELITSEIVKEIPTAFDAVESLSIDASNAINTGVDNAIADFSDFATQAVDGITGTLAEVNDQTLINYTKLGTATDNILNTTGANVERIVDTIEAKTLQSMNAVVAITKLTTETADTKLSATVSNFNKQYNRYLDRSESTIQKNTTLIDNVILALNDKIQSVTETFIDQGQTSLEVIDTLVNNLPKAIRDLSDELTTSAKTNIFDPLERSGERIVDALSKTIADAIGADKNDFRNLFKSVLGADTDEDGTIERVVNSMLPDTGLNIGLRAVMFSLATPLIAWSTLQGIAAVNSQRIMHEYSVSNPSQLLAPSELVVALKRGNITPDKFETDLKRLGHYPEDIATLSKLGRQLIDPQSAIDLWLRKLFSEEQLTEALTGVGVNETDQQAIKDAAFYIPPINDLITMGVRDVFTNDIAESLGLFSDFPEEIALHGAKQGLTREWAERYWAAHWVLPSPTMGFDMFHRQIIDRSELELLLRALDIVPAWRDKIVELSYNPLTRVDVRRMHAVGVLSIDEVNKSYRDIGYSPENATKLTDFTVEYNKPPEDRDDQEIKRLSRANILSFYKTKVLDRDETINQLIGLNYSPETAELFVDDIDYKQILKDRKLVVDNLTAKFDQGVIDYSTAENELYKSGLTSGEVEQALNELLAIQDNKITQPSKADLLKFLKGGVITQDIFTASMLNIGYSAFWIDAYIKTIGEV